MGRRDLAPLSLSARSNGLAFTPHYFSGSMPHGSGNRKHAGRPLKPLVPNVATRQYIKGSLCVVSEDEIKSDNELSGPSSPVSPMLPVSPASTVVPLPHPPFQYSSLLNIASALDRKSISDRNSTRRSSLHSYHTAARSRPGSLRSIANSFSWLKRPIYSANLMTMPCEILDEICSNLPQTSLRSFMLVHSYFLDAAAIAMYDSPSFASTYRFAQFVTTVSHSRDYATMVRRLDLLSLADTEDVPLAGWREWKFRNEPLYSLQPHSRHMLSRGAKITVTAEGTHPPPNPHLKDWHLCRDVPIGGILHILSACPRIKSINFSNISIASDFSIVANSPKYQPTAFTQLIFVSDVPKAHTWKAEQISPVGVSNIVDALIKLHRLQLVEIRSAPWLTTDLVRRLANGCESAELFDFSNSGMNAKLPWGIRGNRLDLAEAMLSEEEKAARAREAAERLWYG